MEGSKGKLKYHIIMTEYKSLQSNLIVSTYMATHIVTMETNMATKSTIFCNLTYVIILQLYKVVTSAPDSIYVGR